MLHPFFQQRFAPAFLISSAPDELVAQPGPLAEGIFYRITSYCQVGDGDGHEYTLVKWQFGDEEEFTAGETLFRDRQAIAMTGGLLPIWQPKPEEKARTTVDPSYASVWDRVDTSVGRYGLPSTIAIELRNLNNWIDN